MDFERRDEGDAFGFTWEDDKKPKKEKKKTEDNVKAIPKKKE
jgi:hypothetical protein